MVCTKTLSYTPCRHTAISPGVEYLYPPPLPLPYCVCANVIQHPELPSFDNNNHSITKLNKLPLFTIIYIYNNRQYQRILLINTNIVLKVQHLVQYVSIGTASNETLTFYFRFQMTNMCYF